VSRAAILASVVVFGLVWAAASRQSVSRVYASAFIPKEDWRGATSFVAARVCPTSHIYSVVAGNMDFGVGYYDPALMHRSQWVSIAPGYYDGSLTDVVAKVKYYGHDWYVLFNSEESFVPQGADTVNAYLTQHGWQFTQFQGLVVYYQPGPC
jgi:hypothetical protein